MYYNIVLGEKESNLSIKNRQFMTRLAKWNLGN